MSVRELPAALNRTQASFRKNSRTDVAAALTYFGVLSLFPAIFVFVALLSLFGEYPRTYDSIVHIIENVASPDTVRVITGPLKKVIQDKGGAGALLGLGILASLWAASGYLGAFMRSANSTNDFKERRSFIRMRVTQVSLTVAALIAATVVGIGLVASGELAKTIGNEIGLASSTLATWNVVKWPILIVVAAVMISVLYYFAPDRGGEGRFRVITYGSLFAILIWGIASFAFGLYVSNFASYNATYGSLGAIVTFLVWLWIGNIAILAGAELDAQLRDA